MKALSGTAWPLKVACSVKLPLSVGAPATRWLGESGVTWLPYVFDRLDTEYEDRARSLGFKLRPSDYFRRQGYVTYQQDNYLEPIVPLIGEDNIIWVRRGSEVEAFRAASLSEKEVFPLPDDAIHSVTNPIRRLTGAIHVYGGDFFVTAGRSEWDPETLRERPFDLAAARASFREANERFESGR